MPQVPGLPLILPDYARVDLGYEAPEPVGAVTVQGQTFNPAYRASGKFLDVPLTFTHTVATTAAPGNRVFGLSVVTPELATVLVAPAAVAQAPSTTLTYSWSALLAAPIAPSGTTVVATPFSPVVLRPGWVLAIGLVSGTSAADVFAGSLMRVMHFPTGPLVAPAPPVPVPVALP